jgi:hypothetical protein
LEDAIRPNHQEESASEILDFSSDNPYENTTRKNEQFSSVEKESSGLEFIRKMGKQPRGIDSNNGSTSNLHGPFGYHLPNRSGTYSSFAGQSDNIQLTASYLQLNHSRNSGNPGSERHSESISSFHQTNYEDSEFMIQAYQRKKKAYEKCKQKSLQTESDLHMEKQRCKMFQEENKRLKLSLKKLDKKYKQQVQANAKQEKEQLRRALELSNKEKDMYQKDRENLKKDNLKLRKTMQELVNQNNVLKRQITILEQQEDMSNDQKSDTIKEHLDKEINRLKLELTNEAEKSKKWEQFNNELKIGKQKAENDNKSIKEELQSLRKRVKEISDRNTVLENEKSQAHNKAQKYQQELNNLKNTQIEQMNQMKSVAQPSFNNQYYASNEPQDEVKETNDNYQSDNYSYHSDHNYESPPVLPISSLKINNIEEQKKSQPVVKKERPKIASELFHTNEQSYDSHLTNNTDNWDQQENTQHLYEDETQDHFQYLGTKQTHQNFQTPSAPVQKYQPPSINTAEAEDFFSNLGQAPLQTPQAQQMHHFEQPVEQSFEQSPDTPRQM